MSSTPVGGLLIGLLLGLVASLVVSRYLRSEGEHIDRGLLSGHDHLVAILVGFAAFSFGVFLAYILLA